MENTTNSTQARETINEILSLINLATVLSELEHCRNDFEKRFLSVYCPTRDDDIVNMVADYEKAITEKSLEIRKRYNTNINS